jgi:hypothetical protein
MSRGQQVQLVVPCTNRKRTLPHPALTIRAMADTRSDRPWERWRERLENVEADRSPAGDLYSGQHWYEAKRLVAEHPRNSRVTAWICSAGYGLVSPGAMLKAYSATFTPSTQDSVSRLGDSVHRDEAVRQWWAGLADWAGPEPGQPRRLADVAREHPTDVMIVALSRPYFEASRDDLLDVAENMSDPEKLLIVSPEVRHDIQRGAMRIQPLPVDGRAISYLGGTMSTVGIRFVRHLLMHATWSSLRASDLRRAVERWMSDAPKRERPTRERTSDEVVTSVIRGALTIDATRSATGLLREYRDSGNACEQGRFRSLYWKVRGEIDDR